MVLKKESIIYLLLFLISFNSFSQELIAEIKTEKKQRNINNFSGKLNDSITFHVIIDKSAEKFKSTAYFYDKDKQVSKVELYTGTKKPKYITYNVNDNVLTLLMPYGKMYMVQDVDYLTQSKKLKSIDFSPKREFFIFNNQSFNNYPLSPHLINFPYQTDTTPENNVFSHKNITVIIGKIKKNHRNVYIIKTTDDIKTITYKSNNPKELDFLKDLDSYATSFINDKELVEKGNIAEYNGFYSDNRLIFINNDKSKSEINLFYLEETGEMHSKTIPLTNAKIKRLSTYLKDDLLFSFIMLKDYSRLMVYDLKTEKIVEKYDYNTTDFGLRNKVFMKDEDVTDTVDPEKFFKSFYTNKIGFVTDPYNPELYVCVNKSKKGDYIVRVGHTNKWGMYNYHFNHNPMWYMHDIHMHDIHMHDMHRQHTMHNGLNISIPYIPSFYGYFTKSGITTSNFGTGLMISNLIFEAFTEPNSKETYFELHLDQDLKHTKEELTPKYLPRADGKKYKKKLKNFMPFKKESYFYLEDQTRIISYDKNKKAYKIYDFPHLK